MQTLLRSRLIDVQGTQHVYAYACGHLACDDALFQGRLIDFTGTTPVYAVASECCEYPPGYIEQYISVGPYRISAVLGVRFQARRKCSDYDCVTGLLVYGTTGAPPPSSHCAPFVPPSAYWHGIVDNVDITVYYDGTQPAGQELQVVAAGCALDPSGCPLLGYISVTCTFPLRGVFSKHISTCCECPDGSPQMDLFFEGFCGRRKIARFIDVDPVRGLKVFAYAECCPECAKIQQDCCIVVEGCDLVADITDLSGCGCLTGLHTLYHQPDSLFGSETLPVATWNSSPPNTIVPIPSCGRFWNIGLQCHHLADGTPYFILSISSDEENPSCVCSGTAAVLCAMGPDLILDVMFTVDESCFVAYGTTDCCVPSFKVRITR